MEGYHIANEALEWRNSGYNKPLDPNILKFVESQNPNFYKLDQFYNPIRDYFKLEHKMNTDQIEGVMLRVYEYYKTVKANIRREKGP